MKKNKLLLIGGMVMALHLAGTALTAQAAPAVRVSIDQAGVLQVRAQPGVDNAINVWPSVQSNQVLIEDIASTVATDSRCTQIGR